MFFTNTNFYFVIVINYCFNLMRNTYTNDDNNIILSHMICSTTTFLFRWTVIYSILDFMCWLRLQFNNSTHYNHLSLVTILLRQKVFET